MKGCIKPLRLESSSVFKVIKIRQILSYKIDNVFSFTLNFIEQDNRLCNYVLCILYYQIKEIVLIGDVDNQNLKIFLVDFEIWKMAVIIQKFGDPRKKV